jgi:hypothetical protein
MFRADASQIITYAIDGTDPRLLSQVGPVAALAYSFALPGGPDQMSCLLQRSAQSRMKAIDPGRIVCIYRGALRIWEGKLDEAAPDPGGWAITAHGSGTYGGDFMAHWTSWNADNPVDQAITRGLRWVNSGLAASSPYTASQTDDASVDVTTHLSNIADPAQLTWYVRTTPTQNRLSMFALPAAPTRILLATTPALRTLHGYFTTLWGKYEITSAPTYGVTSISNTAQLARHGPMEAYADLSQDGTNSAGSAQAILAKILSRYTAASYGGPFTVRPGQVTNLGGQAVDLGTEEAGEVYLLLLAAGGYGGEVVPALPVTFAGGLYEYDDPSGSATITPYVSVRYDLATLLSNYATLHTVTTAPAKLKH